MKILIISTDTSLFNEGSRATEALKEAASLVEQIHVIVFTKKQEPYIAKNIFNKIFLYPTNSRGSLSSVYDAVSIAGLQTVFHGAPLFDVIEAGDPFYAGAVAYILSRKYKRNYLLGLTHRPEDDLFKEGSVSRRLKGRVAKYVLPRTSGVRVTSQALGEAVSADFPVLAEKIYILAEPVMQANFEASSEKIDLKVRYPDFNIILATNIDAPNKITIKRLVTLMKNMRIRYPRIGLLVIDNNDFYKNGFGLFKPEEVPYIIRETGIDNVALYYNSVQMFIDVSEESRPGGALTEAALCGCPIVAAPSPASAYTVRSGENGFVANPDNLAEFSGRIVEMFETPGLRESIKLFRYEVNRLITASTEQYFPTLIEIWKLVSKNENLLEPDNVEVYTSNLVHSLTSTRRYISEISEKVRNDIKNVGEKIKNDTLNPQKKSPHSGHHIDYTENEVLDVTHILKK